MLELFLDCLIEYDTHSKLSQICVFFVGKFKIFHDLILNVVSEGNSKPEWGQASDFFKIPQEFCCCYYCFCLFKFHVLSPSKGKYKIEKYPAYLCILGKFYSDSLFFFSFSQTLAFSESWLYMCVLKVQGGGKETFI